MTVRNGDAVRMNEKSGPENGGEQRRSSDWTTSHFADEGQNALASCGEQFG
jgi:hypothetical protein